MLRALPEEMMSTLISTAGWLGGLAIVTGYVLLLTHRIRPDDRSFLVLNTVGGGLLTASAIYAGAWPNTVINLMWLLSGLYALFVKRSHQPDPATPEPAGDVYDELPAGELVTTR